MTKSCEFLVPNNKRKNFAEMVSKMLEPSTPVKKQGNCIPEVSKRTSNKARSLVTTVSVTRTTQFDGKCSNTDRSEDKKSHLRKVMRYIKKKLWEKGIENANIYISADTIARISEKIKISDSMGSDQNRVDAKCQQTINCSSSPSSVSDILSSPSSEIVQGQTPSNIE